MTEQSARERIAERVKNAYAAGYNDGQRYHLTDRMGAVADAETERILEVVFSEVVSGATVDEMSHAMGRIRAQGVQPTYAAMGEHIWQLRYDRAGKEAERYRDAFGADDDGGEEGQR